MTKYTLIIGLNDKETKQQEIETNQVYNIIVEELKNNGIDGATFTECKGLYIHKNGTAVFENSIKIELLFTTEITVKTIAQSLKIKLNQESIVLESQPINSDLI